MNIREIFRDHKDGGDCYILKADSKNKWCGFNKSIIDSLKKQFGEEFNLVLWGTKSESDYYCIPFTYISHLFTEDRMTKGKLADEGNERWTAIIVDHVFKMNANSHYSANIELFYGSSKPISSLTYVQKDRVYDIDFSIEDAKSEVKVRVGQSPFRKRVLENFNRKCCISGISESELLIASHIVPWSLDKNYRGDPSNGLCLFVEYDAYFDRGYISLNDELEIIVSNMVHDFDSVLKERILSLEGVKIAKPTIWDIGLNHVKVHRTKVFKN